MSSSRKTKSPSEKNKLFINEIGKIVCEYITDNFNKINSYDFTSEIEDDLDKISLGDEEWTDIIKKVSLDRNKKKFIFVTNGKKIKIIFDVNFMNAHSLKSGNQNVQ